MAFIHGSKTSAFFQHWNLTTGMRSITLSGQKELADTTYMGNTDRTFIEGMRVNTVNVSGIFDDQTGDFRHNIERAYGIGERPLTISFGGVNNQQTSYLTTCLVTSFGETSPISDVVMVDADFQVTSDIKAAYFMHNGPIAGLASTNWIDLGDDDWDNKFLRIHVWNAPTGTVNLRLQETDDISGTPTINNKASIQIERTARVVDWENTTTTVDLGRYVRLSSLSGAVPSVAAFIHVSNNL